MVKENIVRCICDRCGKKEDVVGWFFTNKYPKGWKKIEEHYLCKDCVDDFESFFKSFLLRKTNGRKRGF
jgi:transposase-like protein